MNTPLTQSVQPRPSSARRAVLAAMALIIALSLLTACRNKEESAQPAAAEPTAPTAEAVEPAPQDAAAPAAQPLQPTPVSPAEAVVAPAPAGSITLWHSWSQADGDALALILKDFQLRYPDVTVETLFVAYDDLLQGYAQAVAAGSGPDLLLAPNWWLADLTTLGAVQPLDDRLPTEHLAALWPAAVDNLRVGGSLFGLPTTYELVALYYNQSLLTGGSLPASLDDLLAQAQQPGAGIGLYANPFHVAWGFPAFGGALFDAAGHAVLDQGDGASRFLSWLAAVNAAEGSYVDSDYGMLLDRFKKGEFAFFVDGPWALPELSGVLGDSLGVAPLPPGPAGPAQPWLYADAVYINPQASPAQQDLALLFAEQLTGPAAGTILAQTAGRLPANRAATIDGADPRLAGFAQQANAAQAMPHGPHMDAFWRYGGDMIFKALTGAQEPQSIVVETAALINETTGQ